MKDIVYAKIAVPELPPYHVRRPRLLSRFLSSLSWKIIFIAAPIGYGKTVLLSEWHQELSKKDGFSPVWISLDDLDAKEDVRFWKHLIVALGDYLPHLPEEITLFENPLEMQGFFESLSNFLFEQTRKKEERYVIFIDNLDVLSTKKASEMLNFFVKYLPPTIRIVTAGSVLPQNCIDYQYLDSILEFAPRKISFTQNEIQELIIKSNVGIKPEGHAKQLRETTRGWISGIRLYVDAVSTKILETDSFDNETLRLVVDRFFSSCVFQKLSEDSASFLLETSILENFNPSLCDHLTSRNNSKSIITSLVSKNFFVESVDKDNDCYCYHPLFLKWLRNQLLQLRIEQIRKLCHRAAEWYEKRNMPIYSAKFTLLASDSDLVESLASLVGYRRENSHESFVSWIIAIPAQTFSDDPVLSLLVTWSYYCIGRSKETLSWLRCFKRNFVNSRPSAPQTSLPNNVRAAAIISRHVSIKCRDFEQYSTKSSGDYQELLSSQEEFINPALRCIIVHALAESFERTGKPKLAEEYYLQAEAFSEMANSQFFVAFSQLGYAWVQNMCGQYKRTMKSCYRSLQICPQELTLYGALYTALAFAQTETHDLNNAEVSIKRAFKRLSTDRNSDMLVEANAVHAHFIAATGDLEKAYKLIVQTTLMGEKANKARGVLLLAYATQARIALLRENLTDALAAHKKLVKHTNSDDAFYILVAKSIESNIFFEQGRINDALDLAIELEEKSKELHFDTLTIRAFLIQTKAHDRLKNTTQALKLFNKSLMYATPASIVSPFLQERQITRKLLGELIGVRKTDSITLLYAKKLSKILNRQNSFPHAMPHEEPDESTLTKREKEIYLLLKAGLSRTEIATDLNISLNTVKTHLNNIYSKLGVANRSEMLQISQSTD